MFWSQISKNATTNEIYDNHSKRLNFEYLSKTISLLISGYLFPNAHFAHSCSKGDGGKKSSFVIKIFYLSGISLYT